MKSGLAPARARWVALGSALTLLLCVLPVVAQGRHGVRRIHFKRGATVATVRGYLSGRRDRARFVLRVRAGQTMKVTVDEGGAGTTQITIDSPTPGAGEADYPMGRTSAGVEQTVAGDYYITVTEHPNGPRWRGSFTLRVEVL